MWKERQLKKREREKGRKGGRIKRMKRQRREEGKVGEERERKGGRKEKIGEGSDLRNVNLHYVYW